MENRLLILSACFCGTRWINLPSYGGYNNRFETTTICVNRDNIRGEHKCAQVRAERSFQVLHAAADIAPESIARLIFAELQEMQISVVRLTQWWPEHPRPGQELGPASVVVVLQTNRAWEAAVHFHKNDQFHDYSFDLRGLVCQEYRSTRRGEPPVRWNMQEVWKRRTAGNEPPCKPKSAVRHCTPGRMGQTNCRLTELPLLRH